MKFKTRLRVTFISIILLPLLLTIMAFVMIAIYLMNYSQGLSLTDIDYSMMSENFREFTNTTDQAYYVLLDQVKEDSSRLEDKEYLDHINEEVSRKSTYIIEKVISCIMPAMKKPHSRFLKNCLPMVTRICRMTADISTMNWRSM